ncbi:MAG TPA: hypothetical protein VK625_07705, partial [Flavitalea sp.]|nr:hypothetical protein [Flavitalea sp.]
FISHSHSDKEKAIALSGYLFHEFDLRSFVDSCVWGYANDLLKLINDKYCKSLDGKLYDYNKTVFSSSHVHMMLSSAISSMMDRTECLFFYNSPKSISAYKGEGRVKRNLPGCILKWG